MRILLDTHIYLWFVKDDRRLSKQARITIEEATAVYVSSASIWEAAIKIKLGKLEGIVEELIQTIDESGFESLPITLAHVAQVHTLPDVHRDPFDRILLAQATSEPLRLLTSDELLASYSSLVDVV